MKIKYIFVITFFLLGCFNCISQNRPPENYTGQWVIRDTNGRIFSTLNYVNGIEEGEATWYFENNEVKATGKFVNGKQNGEWVYKLFDGRTERANYLNGKMHGDWTLYYKNGNIQQKNFYVNGKIEGEAIAYYENGNISVISTEVNGIRTSVIEYDSLGVLKKGEYSETMETNDGKMTLKGYYKNGSLSGKVLYFNEHGLVVGKGNFKKGVCHGEQFWYFIDGKIKSKSKYINGRKTEEFEYDELGNVKKNITL